MTWMKLKRMAALVKRRSHCGLGQTAANPVLDALQRFPRILEQRLAQSDFEPYFDLDAALEEARQVTHRDDAAAHLESRGCMNEKPIGTLTRSIPIRSI